MAYSLTITNPMSPRYRTAIDALDTNKTTTEEGLRRKGDWPRDLPPLTQCVDGFNMSAVHIIRESPQSSDFSDPYPPSVAPLKSLKQTKIKDLKLGTHHRGHYLLLRFICEAKRKTAVTNIVEDEDGNGIQFSLYHQNPSLSEVQNVLKKESVFILKEPYFKIGTKGQYEIRVDHSTDVFWLSDDDSRVPEKWRKPIPNDQNRARYWINRGIDLRKKGDFLEAIVSYSKGLRLSPNSAEERKLYDYRAAVNGRFGAFDAALEDVSFVENPDKRSEISLHRGALAFYGLGKFEEALELLKILVSKYPNSARGKHQFERTRRRLSEQNKGVYDFNAMYKATEQPKPMLDFATFKGPVEIRESASGGRGLFTTRPVKVGELLLCEKAFSYCFPCYTVSTVEKGRALFMDEHQAIRKEICANLTCNVSNKLALNPSLQPSFEDLVHGEFDGVKGIYVDGVPVLDTFLIEHAVQQNCFIGHLTSRHAIMDTELDLISKYKMDRQDTSGGVHLAAGVWILASYMKHSCDSNCAQSFIGDMQIARAARDMPANTKLTSSRGTSTWGFQCECRICVADRATSDELRIQRREWTKAFCVPVTTFEEAKIIMKDFKATYGQPASEVPRLELFNLQQLLLTADELKSGDPEALIATAFAALESLGFIIEGGQGSKPRLVVRKWGFPHYRLTFVWTTLRDMYRVQGKYTLSEQAHEFARISWLLLVGEDATFA